ncbi:11620_t:CDS:2 [Ambispora gerdemannii]|uniref:11620_t:CDS:1 n=1 Tax=Ambispora gerdemannii TaxID=144530 RepID=A0A9N9B0S0_9GLOM|nr:11620_t:CDS:2 [Ambispora gerdemannii]
MVAIVPNGEAYPTTKRCGGCGNWDHPDSVSVPPTTDANQSYGFPIRYAEEPKNRTTPYETLPYGYG